MANQEHLDILNRGVQVWNQWRKEHADIQPDLREADLSHASLSGANLSRVDLYNVNFTAADLTRVNFSRANLWTASFWLASLAEANFSGADLIATDFWGADLSGASLNEALVGFTVFEDVDLSKVKGLESVRHQDPSSIGISTIYQSGGNIPEAFMKGAGVPDSFFDYMRSLVGKPIEYYSCFISYSSKDDAFARRLYADLQSNNVRCWFAPEDLKWGQRIRTGIDEAIRLHDKLLLILSKHSVASGWVEHEVKAALAKERKEKQVILFPVRLDKAILDSPLSWAAEIRYERNIGDFSSWKGSHDAYRKSFDRLLRDLKAERPRRK